MSRSKQILILIAAIAAISVAVVLTTSGKPDAVIIDADGKPVREIRIDPLSGKQKVREPMAGATGGSPTNELACEDAGGTWNACGSACRNKPGSEMCIQVCVEYCECASSSQCPSDENNVSRLTCTEFVDGTGVCK